MNIGMLWFDNDPKAEIAIKIDRAATYYHTKYGIVPNLCFIHPSMVNNGSLQTNDDKMKSGDIFFFFTRPEKRKVKEGVGHIGFVKIEERPGGKEFYLIHASGAKNKGGTVKKVLLPDYISKMPFLGVKITRFE